MVNDSAAAVKFFGHRRCPLPSSAPRPGFGSPQASRFPGSGGRAVDRPRLKAVRVFGLMDWFGGLVARFRRDGRRAAPIDARTQVKSCIRDEIVPALEAVRYRLADDGYDPDLDYGDTWASLAVTNFNGLPLEYRVRGRIYKEAVVNLASMSGMDDEDPLKRYGRIEIYSGGRTREYPPGRCSRAAVERAALKYFRRFLLDSPGG